MKNILLVGESYSGGVKTYIDTIMENQQQMTGNHLKALVSSKRLEPNESMSTDYMIEDNLSFGKSPIKLVKALMTLDRAVKKNEIDVIHANSTFSGLVMYLYSKYNRTPFYIYTPHGYYSFKNMGKLKKHGVTYIEKKINAASDLVIHVSPSEENAAFKNNLVTPEKSTVILNGAKDPEAKNVRKNDKRFTVVNLARVDDPKNPLEFIEIARKVVEKIPSIQFIWAGNGRYLEEVKEKVETLQLGEKIKFIGFLKNKEKVLAQSDLYLSTSQYEGLPFAVVEAMSYRLPLLLSDITGHSDLVKKTNGMLFKSNEHDNIYEFIQELIDNKEKWNSMSDSSHQIFTDRFTVKQMVKNLSEIYQKV